MTIQEFEQKIKEIFIQKKWKSKNQSWFWLDISSHYKHKQVDITRLSNYKRAVGWGNTYEEAFESCIKRILNGEHSLGD